MDGYGGFAFVEGIFMFFLCILNFDELCVFGNIL